MRYPRPRSVPMVLVTCDTCGVVRTVTTAIIDGQEMCHARLPDGTSTCAGFLFMVMDSDYRPIDVRRMDGPGTITLPGDER